MQVSGVCAGEKKKNPARRTFPRLWVGTSQPGKNCVDLPVDPHPPLDYPVNAGFLMTSATPSAAQQQPSAANAAPNSQQATAAVPAQLPTRSYASAATKTAAPAQNNAGKVKTPSQTPNMQNGDHGRKPSVIISASGTTGQIPNGGPAPQSSRPNINFGSMNGPSGSPAIASSVPAQATTPNLSAANPRITSPSHSPSPIPQPAASGGKPPANLPGQSNAPNFGSFGAENAEVSILAHTVS